MNVHQKWSITIYFYLKRSGPENCVFYELEKKWTAVTILSPIEDVYSLWHTRTGFVMTFLTLLFSLQERGESFYQDRMNTVVQDLKERGFLEVIMNTVVYRRLFKKLNWTLLCVQKFFWGDHEHRCAEFQRTRGLFWGSNGHCCVKEAFL